MRTVDPPVGSIHPARWYSRWPVRSPGFALSVGEKVSPTVGEDRSNCNDGQDYQTTVDAAAQLPKKVIQEDEKLLMYYGVAIRRLGEDG